MERRNPADFEPTVDLNQLETIPQRFEMRVREQPAGTAIATGTVDITYAELNHRASLVAAALVSRGIVPGMRVAFLLDQNEAPIVTVLGILKAGAVQVALDPLYPESRLTMILEHAGAALLITEPSQEQLARAIVTATPICMLADLEAFAGSAGSFPSFAPDSPAWIIYTSGSTGVPKGVLQIHCNVNDIIRRWTKVMFFTRSDRISLLPACGSSQWQNTVFAALLNGATIVPFNVRRDGIDDTAERIASMRISAITGTPTFLRRLIDTGRGFEDTAIRLVRIGGEPLRPDDVRAFRRWFPRDAVLMNSWSMTETGSLAAFPIDKDTPIDDVSIPIGYPSAGVDVAVVGEKGERLEPGQVGELVVTGRFFSPGYWHDAERTELLFTTVDESGLRRFKTGDVGRQREDGSFEHLGRKDFRVKIRGFGVELGEVEGALAAHPAISHAVVATKTSASDDTALAAYLKLKDGSPEPTVSEMRVLLARTLPDYMVPTEYLIVDTLPVTPGGKVDRRAIAELGNVKRLRTLHVPPRTAHEQSIAAIWADLLNLETVGVDDDFFGLGGDSLTATQVLLRMGENIPLRTFFENPTISALAAVVAQQEKDS